MSKYSEKAYRELYSLAGLLEKFNNDLKNEEVVPWEEEIKDRITGDIEEWSYMLKSYAGQINDFEFVEDYRFLGANISSGCCNCHLLEDSEDGDYFICFYNKNAIEQPIYEKPDWCPLNDFQKSGN